MAGREDIFKKAMSAGHSAAWDQLWDKAAVAYQQALVEFPDNPKALSSLGLALFELQRFEESLQAYQRAAQASPDDPVPLEKIAQISEHLGNLQQAIQASLRAAELYIKSQDSDKALVNWLRVTRLDADNVTAHSYLAMVHERLAHIQQAVTEYLALASLFQRTGSTDKAAEMIGRALRLKADSSEARQAQSMLKAGQLLPKPMRPQGGTGPLRMAQVHQLEPPEETDTGLDPVAEDRQKALTRLAEVLFDISEEDASSPSSKRGLQSIVHGTGQLDDKKGERTRISMHIGQAIDAQTKQQDAQAMEELDKALEAGFTDPALYFDLGLLRSATERVETALRHLQHAVNHEDYALASHLLMGQIQRQLGRLPAAAMEYVEALKIADAMVVTPDQADELRQLYDPLIESQSTMTDEAQIEQLCDNIKSIIYRPKWRAQVIQAREQLPKPAAGAQLLPLAEILTQAQSSQVIDAITRVRQLAGAGHLRSAMDEAFESLKFAPSYLPLHTLIGDLLIEDNRLQDAITKYNVVAEAYSVRGEASQAISLLRRIVQASPMDLVARTRLIDQLAARGQVDEAIGEYIELADIYYRLAELDQARTTYTTALRLAQQGNANRAWSVKLLKRMADIDMQRLDWRQALRIFEQIRTLEPNDFTVRKNLIDLNIRLNQSPQVTAELDSLIGYLQSTSRRADAIPLLNELVSEYPQQVIVRRYLAEEYHQAGNIPEAVAQLDALAETLLNRGDRPAAIQIIEAIVAMNPPNLGDYRNLLVKIKAQV